MRHFAKVFFFIALVMTWSVGFVQQVRADQADTDASADAPRQVEGERTIQQKLGDVVENTDIRETTVKQAVEWYALRTGIDVVVNWAALEAEGIDLEKKIDLKLKAVPAGKLLGLLLEQSVGETTLIYEVTPCAVIVTTKTEADKKRVTKVYDVRDLIMDIPNFSAPQNIGLEGTQQVGANHGGGGGTGILGNTGADTTAQQSDEERAQALIDVIQQTVEPDVWDVRGGEASVKYFRGMLVISAPAYVHQQLGTEVGQRTITPRTGSSQSDDGRPRETTRQSQPVKSTGVSTVRPEGVQ